MIPEKVRKFIKTMALIRVRINNLPLSSFIEIVSKLRLFLIKKASKSEQPQIAISIKKIIQRGRILIF
jgi:hypothetical protein